MIEWDIILFLILIILFIVIVIMAVIGKLNLTPLDKFGTWEKKCINFDKVLNTCIPNQNTKYGCLIKSNQTFNPYIEYTDCDSDVAEYFTEEIIKDCDNISNEKSIYYKCVSRKKYGLSKCIHNNEYYNVGEGYYEYVKCS